MPAVVPKLKICVSRKCKKKININGQLKEEESLKSVDRSRQNEFEN